MRVMRRQEAGRLPDRLVEATRLGANTQQFAASGMAVKELQLGHPGKSRRYENTSHRLRQQPAPARHIP
jgi:hypothetical protein